MQNLCSPRIKSEADVFYELQTMPKRLQDFYTQIYEQIQSIAVPSRRIATTALQWLICAKGRLSSQDFITVVSVNEYSPSNCLSASKLLDICGNLVVLDTELDVFRFAHLSVREFLEEKPEFAPDLTHGTAAEICLNTLLANEWLSSETTWQEATLYQYVTLYWASHVESCRKDLKKGKIGDRLRPFTRTDRVEPWFAKWLLQIESASETLGWNDPLKEKIEHSLCYPETYFFAACAFGFLEVVEKITSTNPPMTRRVNARGATGLHLASQFGHDDIVRTLIERGAETDARDKQMETALIRASSAGHEDIVALLLARRADRSAEGKRFGNALQAACLHGHEAVVDSLVDGIDIEAESGQFGTALQAASLRGHKGVVQTLLRAGAEVNTLGGHYTMTADLYQEEPSVPSRVDKALEFLFHRQAFLEREIPDEDPSERFKEELTVGRLIDEGIDINVSKIGFGSALQAASRGGHEAVATVLLNHGADVHVEGGTYGSATQAAAVSGRDEVTTLLIQNRADINVQNGLYSTALQAACRFGHETVVKTLIEHGADVNAQGGLYGSALQAACRTGSMKIIELLFKHEADVNNFGGSYFSPLQAASAKGSLQIVQLLLNKGAKLNVRGGQYGSALQAASRGGHLKVVEFLIANGARPEASLQIAVAAGHIKVVKFLLDQDVDPNVREFAAFGNLLENAVATGREDLTNMLCERGTEVVKNPPCRHMHFGTALPIASSLGNKQLVRLLLERGADPSESGRVDGLKMADLLHGTSDKADTRFKSERQPLGLASAAGHEEVVEMLLQKFAEPTNAFNIGWSLSNALEGAATNGHMSIVKLLLDYQDQNHWGDKVPLKAACAGGHTDIVRFLIGRCADGQVVDESLLAATQARNVEIVQMFLQRGANVTQDSHFGTLLHIASCNGSAELARLFLDLGAEVDRKGTPKITPLMLASARGHDAAVRLLLERGADPGVLQDQTILLNPYFRERNFGSPLLAAAHGGHEAIVHMLLDHPRYHENESTDQDKHIDICAGEFGTALQVACLKGNTTIVELLLSQGAQTNVCGGPYGSALQAACWTGNETIVQLLFDHGSNINLEGGLYGTPLQAAAAGGHGTLVRLMLCAGAKVRLPAHGSFGSALIAAASSGDPEIVRCLLDNGADIGDEDKTGETSLHEAARSGHEAVVELLLQRQTKAKDAHQEGRSTFWRIANHVHESLLLRHFSRGALKGSKERSDDTTPMHYAAQNGHLNVLKKLLEETSDIAAKDYNGRTPLLLAAANGKHLAVRLLLQHGAAVDDADNDGCTALHLAVENGHKSTIRILLEAKADIGAKVHHGDQTPMHLAAYHNQYEAAYLLWINGADLNARTAEGETALLIAANQKATPVLSLLATKDAGLHDQDEAGRSALLISAKHRHKEAVQILLDNGANVHDQDKDGCTALHLAVQPFKWRPSPCEWVVQALLDKGANINGRDHNGRTPLHKAVLRKALLRKEFEPVRVLLNRGADVTAQDQQGNTALDLSSNGYVRELLVAQGANVGR